MALGDSAEELPGRDVTAVECAIRATCLEGREELVDRGVRGCIQAQRGSLDPVVREHRETLTCKGTCGSVVRQATKRGEAVPDEAHEPKGIAPVPWLFALFLFVLSAAAIVVGAHDAA